MNATTQTKQPAEILNEHGITISSGMPPQQKGLHFLYAWSNGCAFLQTWVKRVLSANVVELRFSGDNSRPAQLRIDSDVHYLTENDECMTLWPLDELGRVKSSQAWQVAK